MSKLRYYSLNKTIIYYNSDEELYIKSSYDKNAIISSNTTSPENETFVFADHDFTGANVNPNYSKVRISLSGDSAVPIFTFPVETCL